MPRQPRLVLPHVAIHLIQRGNNRSACFAADSDRHLYLLHLSELSKKFSCAVHAYCLMPNHVHLLLTPVTAQDCAALMRELGQRYVQYFNRRYKRSGTLWEGRFRSCVAESASARLLPIHRVKPGPRVPRCEAGRLPLVQLPRKFRRSHRIPAVAASRIPGLGDTYRRAICRLRRAFRARARAIASGRHSKCDQWRLSPGQRIVQVGTSRIFRPKGGAGAAWPAQQGSAEIGL